MQIVIGSGPASIAAAQALLSKGVKVVLIEPGCRLEKNLLEVKNSLGQSEPSEWTTEKLSPIKDAVKSTTKGIPKKLVYGSDYVYRDLDQATPLNFKSARMTRSFATGGLSNVWGACLLPYPHDELINWPIGIKDLSEHYRSVLNFVPHTGVKDALADRLPLYSDHSSKLPLSRQAQNFLDDLKKKEEPLRKSGILFGHARLALSNNPEGPTCRSCGLCLYGCPYELIYSTEHTLRNMLSHPNFIYRSELLVQKVSEAGRTITVHARNIKNGQPLEMEAERVFLGAGVVESTRIVAESLDHYEQDIKIQHSDRFMMPFLRMQGTSGVATENLNTLCQLFIELNDSTVSKYDVHLQAYTYNDLYKKALDNKLGILSQYLQFPISVLLSRLIIFFGYIHSEESSHLLMKVIRKATGSEILVRGVSSGRPRTIALRTFRKILSQSLAFKGLPGLPALDPPGGGNHTGGSLPMKLNPGFFESDQLGRPTGFKYLHVVDSSVFPSLPAATITLSIMANSHRIACQAGEI